MFKNFLIFVVLSLVFAGLFTAFKTDAGLKYQAEIKNIPSVQLFGVSPSTQDTVAKFGIAAGAAFGLIAFILSAILFGILKIVKVPAAVATGISSLLAYGGVAALGYELVYLEEKNSALASAIVNYIGKPLFYSGIIAAVLAIGLLLTSLMKKKAAEIIAKPAAMLLLLLSPLLLSGCTIIGDLTQVGCGLEGGQDAAHCYQEAAVQKNDEQVCNKAPQGEAFKDLGSNPPKDKCYYMVAMNKKDPSVCNNIKGGTLSYEINECASTVLDSSEKFVNEKLKKTDGGKNLSPEELLQVQQQMAEYNKMADIMSNMTKSIHDMNAGMVRNLR
jgi:type III secretion apparatus needle protein